MLTRSDLRVIVRDFFYVFKWIGLVTLAPGFIALIYNEAKEANIFLALGALIFLIGYFGKNFIKTERETEYKHALVTVALIWIVTPLLGMFPFFYTGLDPVSSLFEAMAGWTTTGLTVVAHPENLPYSILFWRSLMQWVGGIGIIVAALGGIFRTGGKLLLAEAGKERIVKPNIYGTFKTIWWIYAIYTVVGILAFWFFGMPLFDSVVHSFSGISTGGMSIKANSIGAYQSFAIEFVAIFLMISGAISFFSHFCLLKGDWKGFFGFQLKALGVVLFMGSLLILPFTPIRETVFHVISAATTTGYTISSMSGWGSFPKLILLLLMFVGGAAGSTAGGIKLLRAGISLKEIWWELRSFLTPGVVVKKKIAGRELREREVRIVLIFILIFLAFFVFGTGVLTALGYSLLNSAFESLSALSVVGLSSGIVGTQLALPGKLALIVNMYVGRLELWAALSLIMAIIIKR